MKLPFLRRTTGRQNQFQPLPIPEPAPACNPNTRVRAGDLKAWLEELPNANPLQVCREVRAQLELLVRYPEPIAKFHSLIDTIDPVATDIVGTILRKPATSFGDTTLEHTLEHELQPMLLEYSHACKRAINEQLAAGQDPGARLLFRCASAMSLVILIESLTYRGMPPQCWRELLQLYEIATMSGHSTDIDGIEGGLHGATSIHEIFFGTLLTQLADPLHLSPQQTWDLFATTTEYAHLLDFDGSADAGWCINVDMTGSTAPLETLRRGSGPEQNALRWLNLGPLMAALEQAERTPTEDWLRETIQGIAGVAGIGEGRRHARVEQQAAYQAYTGLGQIHARLIAMANTAGAGGPTSPPQHCLQVNQSQSGAAFVFAGGQRRYPRVNDLLLVEGTNEQGRLTGYAAVVRRMRRLPDDQVEIGVERLIGNFTPMTMLDPPDVLKGRDLPVALIRHSPQLEGLELLAPTGTWGSKTTFNLSGPSSKHKLQLIELNAVLNGIELIQVSRDN